MKVRDLMRRNPRVASPGMSLARAGQIMAEAQCGALPVVGNGSEERVVGMITDRDIALAVCQRRRLAGEIEIRHVMSGEVFTCRPDDELEEALITMRDFSVRRLPVVDSVGRIVGILTLDDAIVEAGPGGVGGPALLTQVTATLKTICRREQMAVSR